MFVGAGGSGDALPPGAQETSGVAGPSPSQVGEDEEARDDVMRGGSGRAGRCRGSGNEDAGAVSYGMGWDAGVDTPGAADGTPVSRWISRGRGDRRRCAKDAAGGRRRATSDGPRFGSAANRGFSGERSEVRCKPG